MGGLNWDALPIVSEMLGITDMEPFITQLAAIRDSSQETSHGG